MKDTGPVFTENADPVFEDNTEILERACKMFDVLFIDLPPPSGNGKSEPFGQMDPCAILTLESQTNKAACPHNSFSPRKASADAKTEERNSF